jgi:hypothetical protein
VRPNHTRAEGSVYNGLEHPFCRDCNSCDSVLLPTETPIYRAYRPAAKRARLVGLLLPSLEVQSHEYTTTQQNVARDLQRNWNTNEMIAALGRPICVVGRWNHSTDPIVVQVQWHVDILFASTSFGCPILVPPRKHTPKRSDRPMDGTWSCELLMVRYLEFVFLALWLGFKKSIAIAKVFPNMTAPASWCSGQWWLRLALLVLILGATHGLQNDAHQGVSLLRTRVRAVKLDEPYVHMHASNTEYVVISADSDEAEQDVINGVDPTPNTVVHSLEADTAIDASLNAAAAESLDFLESLDISQPFETADNTPTNEVAASVTPSLETALSDFACQWKPGDDFPCVNRLLNQVKASIKDSDSAYAPLYHRRWIFLGDSTMSRLVTISPLAEYLITEAPVKKACPQYQCETISAGRCDTIEKLKIPRPSYWVPPNFTRAEGPLQYGWENPFCHDCDGCNALLLSCSTPETGQWCILTNTSQAMFGGYLPVEFARDVEIQSDEYITTQENVVKYMERDLNTDEMIADFGHPICIVGAGLHDINIPEIQLEAFLENVRWYLDLLSPVCDHVVWVSNNSPLTDEYAQKKTNEWNLAVRNLLMERDHTSFVDVFAASVEYAHEDNIHMSSEWYNLLGKMFLKVVTGQSIADDNAAESIHLL